jgi:hypothetical protein
VVAVVTALSARSSGPIEPFLAKVVGGKWKLETFESLDLEQK